ncbi:MAG: protein kinase [Myxococcales bacterium]
MSVASRPREDSSLNTVVAGRYQLIERLSQGGMGEVFAARDTTSGRKVALKRLLPAHRQRAALFRAEYHTLARLRHPYIIQVQDFGLDGETPYYTMELLDGQDLLETGPSDYHESCRMLRDVATSLALLHAQRLLHRDLSPRNVRKTSSGRCKLFDFGMMVPFGVPPNLAGTPPFVSPEAWEGSVLDQRSDIYSLGALAYWLITRKLPYEPKSTAQHGYAGVGPPARLRKSVPDLPEALDDLVMSMLELDPVKRPSSAAEVIVRLNQIAGLEPDDAVELAQSYLSSARFVSRRKELSIIDQALARAVERRGGGLLVTGAGGIGRTRLLQEVALLAQTRGARIVRAFGAGGSSSGELVREIYQGLRRAAPEAFKLLDYRDQAIVKQLDRESRNPQQPNTPSPEARARLHAALSAYAHVATAEGTWVFLIDDLHVADPFSNAFVASLAREAENRALLVVATARGMEEELTDTPAALFAKDARHLGLEDLDQDSIRAICSSLFGAVPNLDRLIAWLYRQARGNPALTMELASLLLRRGTIRFLEGAFSLPRHDIDDEVPADLAHTLALRLDPLSSHARKVAELVATCRGSAPLELCLSACEGSADEIMAALEELVRHGVLMTARGEYAFAQEAMRNAVRLTLVPAREKQLHGRLADALLASPAPDLEHRLEAGWHLVHTDQEQRGADLLAQVTPPLIESGLAYAGAMAAAEKALEVYERTHAALEKRLALRTILVRAGFLYDYRLAQRYGVDTIRMLENWMGLPSLRRFERFIGGFLMLVLAFAVTALKRAFASPEKRGPQAYLSLKYLCRSLVSLLGVRVLGLDGPGAAELLAKITFLEDAPSWTSGKQVFLIGRAVAMQPLGREVAVRRDVQLALDHLNNMRAADMSEAERLDARAGLMLSGGINECYRAGSDALTAADAVEAVGTQLARASAQRIRLTYHMVRGGRDEADRHRRMLDTHAIQGGTTWQVEWFAVSVEGVASARLGDLVSARRSLERLEELVHEVPTLTPMRDIMRVMYQWRRGNLEKAIELGEYLVNKYPAKSVIGWVAGYGAYAGALNESGNYQKAQEICERARAVITDADREYAIIYSHVDRELAVALAAQGRRAEAEAITQKAIKFYEERREYAWLYAEYENAARIAKICGDGEGVREAVKNMREAAKRANSKFLLAQSARAAATLLRSLPRAERAPVEVQGADMITPVDGGEEVEVHTPVRGFTRSRARNVLKRAMDEAGANAAHLYVLGPDGAVLTASAGEDDPPSQVADEAWSLGNHHEAVDSQAESKLRIRTINALERTYELMLLPRRDGEARTTVLALEHQHNRAATDLPVSVLEKLTAWSAD